jgi:hypothetical protein
MIGTGKSASSPDPFPWRAFVVMLVGSALVTGGVFLALPTTPEPVHLHTLPDGTRCVTYHGSVTCDWAHPPQPQARPQRAPLT